MKKIFFDDRVYLQSELISKSGKATHCFSGKCGGKSEGKINGLNLGFRVGDSKASVLENYGLIAKDFGLDLERAVLSRQKHTDNIRIVTEFDAGKGITKDSDIYDTDGLITAIKGISLIVFAADCVPIILHDPIKNVAAAIHSGWRGTVKKIGGKAVMMMKEHFGCRPGDIVAAIGPSIGPCCFEFGREEAKNYFDTNYCRPCDDDKVYVDIWGMNADILKNVGISSENIDVSNICTVCHSNEYYSYRTHGVATGRQAAIISLR